jgi:hypothetical protein
MSSKSLRYTLLAGLAVAVLAGNTNLAFAQNRGNGWTLGPAYGPGGAYDFVAPGVYGDYSGPPIFARPRDHQRAVRPADKRLLECGAWCGLANPCAFDRPRITGARDQDAAG